MADRVLVVDNDLNLQTLLHVLLARAGYQADFVADGATALQKLRDDAYDAVLLDLMLPSINGLDMLGILYKANAELLPRVIVMSAAPAPMLQKARDFPVHSVIRKPFDISELVLTLRSCAKKSYA